MELNFDKEMDALLRQTARSGETVSGATHTHLDADEISAFAENALPEKTRQFYTAHLADCDQCRKILAQTILMNSEAEAIPASPVAQNETVETEIPWYRRIFALPNLAYAMGALVLVLGGFIGLMVFQNASGTQNSEISQMEQLPSTARGPNLGNDDFVFSETANANMSANTSMSNATAANTVSAPMMNTNASVVSSNTATIAANTNSVTRESRAARTVPAEQAENEVQVDGASGGNVKKDENRNQETVTLAEDSPRRTAPTNPVQAAPPPAASDMQDSAKGRKLEKDMALSASSPTRRIAGKNFNRRDDVWYDAAYKNQSTTNLRRGSDEYRKLDSGLRSIAESLEGTIVVVWKEKAYRID